MEKLLVYLSVFIVGGILCTIAQILIDKTKLMPGRILVIYVCAGCILGAVGITRYVSLGSLLLAVLFPCWVGFTNPGDFHMLAVSLLYTVSAFYMHRTNIRRLLNGTENKLGQRVKISSEDTEQENNKGKDGTSKS